MKKGKELIDITLPKYAGSSAVGDRPILCISNIEEEDEDVYTIEVENASGKEICSEKLVVFGGKKKPYECYLEFNQIQIYLGKRLFHKF